MFEALSSEANDQLKNLFGIEDIGVDFTIPNNRQHGDLATAVALRLARSIGQSPKEIAKKISDELGTLADVERAEVAGAGYVNLWLTPSALLEELDGTVCACTAEPERLGAAPVIVEYSQPNIAKPLGIHHLIGTALGQAVVNLYRHSGASVISWNYMGDWGTQFGKLAVAYEKWGDGKPVKGYTIDALLALYVRFHDEGENDATLDDQGRAAFRKLEEGDPTLRAFWADVVSVTKASLASSYERLHVSFDLDLSESFYEDKMKAVLDEGIKKGVFNKGEGGALIVEFPDKKDMPPYLVQKGDGATLYSTRDIAQMRYRIDTYHPQAIYIFTDIAQKLHFEQLIETCKQLGWKLPEFENVLFGRMRFVDKAMSTRKGNILHLQEVLDEAVSRAHAIIKERGESIQTDEPEELAEMMGVGALVYGILSQNRKMDIVFDWDRMLSFEGNSAPYIQYTHARARSVLRKAEILDGAPLPSDAVSFAPTERLLIGTLLQFPSVLHEARTQHLPHILAQYLYSLCQDFNLFYNTESILQSAQSVRNLRLALTSLTATVLKTGAELLTLRVPDRM